MLRGAFLKDGAPVFNWQGMNLAVLFWGAGWEEYQLVSKLQDISTGGLPAMAEPGPNVIEDVKRETK